MRSNNINNIKTTRLELIRTKARIEVASKGLELLKMKRAALVLEFFELARLIEKLREDIRKNVSDAMDSEKIAEIYAGRISLERIAAEQSGILVGVEVKNVMGVKIPDVKMERRSAGATSYELISVPAAVDDARRNFVSLLNVLVLVAERESSLRRLLYEISKLNRRSNAVENVVIPEMKGKTAYIKQRLDDMERDQIVSLKFIKGKIGGI
jgi:V/A-type H+-transporting ATPase subunit D